MENIPPPQSLEYVLINCGTSNLDTDDSEEVVDGLFCIALALKKRMSHLKAVTNGIIPCDERNTVSRQRSFIVNKLVESKCTNCINTDIHYVLMETGFLKMATLTNPYFIRTTYLIEKGYLKLALPFKRKIDLIQVLLIQATSRKKKIFTANYFPPLPSKPKTNTNKQDYSWTINISPRNYNTHSTSGTIKTYLTQSQPRIITKELIPTGEKTPISATFPPKQAKTQSSSTPLLKQMILAFNKKFIRRNAKKETL